MHIGNFFLFLRDNLINLCIKKRRRSPAGVSECPERKERRKRNGHSKLSKVGVQSPEERECRRESESLGPIGVFTPSPGFPPLTNRNVIHFFIFVKYHCPKYFFVLFLGHKTKF